MCWSCQRQVHRHPCVCMERLRVLQVLQIWHVESARQAERGHINERGEQSDSKRPRVSEEPPEAVPTTTPESEWWPTGIDYISAVQCAAA